LRDLELRLLRESDGEAVARLLTRDPPEYGRHFHPFGPEPESVRRALAAAVNDRYWGVWGDEGELVAVVLLRGLDAGYRVPSFGVYVAQAASGSGIGTFALAFAESWCRLNGRQELMLTVHPDNTSARSLYEAYGFRFAGEHSDIGHRIYRKRLGDG
jgi:RimJ/RimL family protein N-acetyltransferase